MNSHCSWNMAFWDMFSQLLHFGLKNTTSIHWVRGLHNLNEKLLKLQNLCRIYVTEIYYEKRREDKEETSWNFKNFDALSWSMRFPSFLFITQRLEGHLNRGIKTRAVTSCSSQNQPIIWVRCLNDKPWTILWTNYSQLMKIRKGIKGEHTHEYEELSDRAKYHMEFENTIWNAGWRPLISFTWYISKPQSSQVYTATCIKGLTSEHRVTIPDILTSWPIFEALTSLIVNGCPLEEALI